MTALNVPVKIQHLVGWSLTSPFSTNMAI